DVVVGEAKVNDSQELYDEKLEEVNQGQKNLDLDLEKNEELQLLDVDEEILVSDKKEQKTLKIETGLQVGTSFSTFNSSYSIESAIENASILEESIKLVIDDEVFYIANQKIIDSVLDHILRLTFPNEQIYNIYKETGNLQPTKIGSQYLYDFSIENDITISKTWMNRDLIIRTPEDLLFKILHPNQDVEVEVITNENSLNDIRKSSKLEENDLLLNNYDMVENSLTYNGQTIIINEIDALIDVAFYYSQVKREPLKYQTRYERTDDLRVGQSQVKRAGKNGVQDVTYITKYVNGKEVSVKAKSYDIIEQSYDKIILEGQKVISGYGTGKLGWPSSSYNITNGYGGYDATGWYGHYAIDIAAWYGAPIYAADNGVVSFSGWDYTGGGWAVRINHRNSMETGYYHMMQHPHVSHGQTIQKGDVIGYEGATGIAFGSHLHYEVKINGVRVNPLYYYWAFELKWKV
ncbi:MAG: peptidoglycan DD-metalloendopeptidase family protein, partial [Spiroplasma sp.]|nr:peptidoglycan DD-metalloendopeptidase family protein [Mycoplasmatales bacterium]